MNDNPYNKIIQMLPEDRVFPPDSRNWFPYLMSVVYRLKREEETTEEEQLQQAIENISLEENDK